MPEDGTRTSRHGRAPLLGREIELADLDDLIGVAAAGNGRALVLEGPAGIGKTELVEAARERARSAGLRVLMARADELEAAYPHGVVRQWLERAWAEASDGRPAGDAAELVLSRVPAVAPVGEDASFGILHALYLFVSELSLERPLLLVLDDAQWADPQSLRFLVYLTRRIEGLGVGVLAAVRAGAAGPAAGLLDRMRDEPAVAVRAVAPLGEADCGALLKRSFGAEVGSEFSEACRRVTGGNPLYLVELQRALAFARASPLDASAEQVDEITPASLSRHVLARLAGVHEDAPRLAGAMSVLGDGGSLRHAARLAGMEPPRAGDIAKLLVRAEILRDEDPIRFVHPIVRRVTTEQLTSVEREDWHLEAAGLLLEERAPPERAAGHLLMTRPGGRDWCVEVLRSAARQAMSRSAHEAAAQYLRRALAEPPEPSREPETLRELGGAEALAHDPSALEHLEQALRATADPTDRAEIALELATAQLDLLRSVEACRVLESALDELDESQHEQRVILEAALASVAWIDAQTLASGVRVLGKYWDEPPPGAPGRAILAQKALAMLLTGAPAERVCATAAAALEEADEDDLRGTFETALSTLILAEGLVDAARLFDRVAELRTVRLVRRRVASLETLRGYLALRHGALGNAELHLRNGLDLTPTATSAGGWLVIYGLLVSVLTYQGDLEAAERLLATAPVEPWPLHAGTSFALSARANLRFAQGQPAEGLADLDKLADQLRRWGDAGPAVHQWRSEAAIALAALGRSGEARSLADEELERSQAFGAPIALGSALRAAGIVHGGARGLELLERAVVTLAGSTAALELGRSHVELGAALRRANQRRIAREHLDAGLRLAQRCGAGPLAQRAYEELLASGKRLRRSDLEDRDALTPAELRIARHAAEGLSNRAIASVLYLSIKTVEMHLGRVYRKLDISARAQLPAALERQG